MEYPPPPPRPLLIRIVRALVWHVKYFLGLRFQVSGWEHLQTPGPYVIISNHQSSLDVLGGCPLCPIEDPPRRGNGHWSVAAAVTSWLPLAGLMEILPDRCTMIAKKELIYAGTVGVLCWLGGIVFINRKKTSDAKSVMAAAAKTMLDQQVSDALR